MEERESSNLKGSVILIAIVILYSVVNVIGRGVLSWHIAQKEYHFMMAEVFCLWLALWLLLCRKMTRIQRIGGIAGLGAVFAWLHMIFLPILFTGCYVVYLVILGRWLKGAQERPAGLCWDFFLGSAATILVFCLLSLAGLGRIGILRIWVLASGGALTVLQIRKQRSAVRRQEETGEGKISALPVGAAKGKKSVAAAFDGRTAMSLAPAAMLAGILALVMLQAGRLNLTVDFDSLWYGVRSHVMLDSGRGIYENLGTLGVVYTYSKGWEVLTLPLAGLPSYSFITAMNLWTAGFTLMAFYETAAILLDRKKALWAPFLAASVPGIMNMSGTAKADMITLFCQILMIQTVFRYEREHNRKWLVLGAAAGCVSLTMKPTAVVFSTAAAGMAAFWLILERILGRVRESSFVPEEESLCKAGQEYRRFPLFLAISFGALAGIWGRTLYLVGVPVTSIFYRIFQRLGFQVKYPFYAAGFPAAGSKETAGDSLAFIVTRVSHVLFNPQGDDMAHVIIAWGGVLPAALLILLLLLLAKKRKRARVGKAMRFLLLLLAALLLIDLVSLYSLSQIDGNYYMLTYGVLILTGCIGMSGQSRQGWRAATMAFLPVWLYGAILCGLTNWAWALGSGGLHPINQGYYPHVQEEREKRAAQGSAAIWDIFAEDPRTRVIALGEHPGVLSFPCWVQSYVDISGYWGNPEVVADAPGFLRYLQYANVDYLYMEREYVDTSVRIYQIIRSLIQEGWLCDVRDENGNLVLSVCRDDTGHTKEETARNLWVFDERYIQHP